MKKSRVEYVKEWGREKQGLLLVLERKNSVIVKEREKHWSTKLERKKDYGHKDSWAKWIVRERARVREWDREAQILRLVR